MSLILDALKKSEAERQRGQAPNVLSPLASMPHHAKTGKKPALPWFVSFALLLLLVVPAYFYMKPQTPVVVVAEPVVNHQETATPANTPAETLPAPLAPAPEPSHIQKQTAPVIANEPVQTVKPETTLKTGETIPEAIDPEPAARVASLSEMSSELRQQLPAMKLSMHVYSADAGKRFAIIDGQRVNEGSVLGEAVIEQIRQDGVVLSVQGQSYLLPRP